MSSVLVSTKTVSLRSIKKARKIPSRTILTEIETVDSPYFLSLNLPLAAEHLNFTRNLAGLLKNISKKGRFYNFFYLNLRLFNFKWTVAQWQWL